MGDVRERFFEELGKQGHVPLLEATSGTVLMEIKDDDRRERWYVTIHRGDVGVSHEGAAPDCVIKTDGSTFDAIVAGETSTMPAVLRGLLEVEGKVGLLVALQAVFKPSTGTAEHTAGYARRQA